MAAQFTIARLWNQPRFPSIEECIKCEIYIMEYYSELKNNKIMAFAGKWMKLENIMLSEINQSQKNQRTNDIANKWMMSHNGGGRGQEWRKEGLYRGKRGVGG